MTKEVMIQIEGLQLGDEEEPIVTNALGSYHLHNGRHVIHYEERSPEENDIIKNTMKIGAAKIELLKKGKMVSRMIFDLEERTETVYQTAYGSLYLEVQTNKIQIEETPEQIVTRLQYSLSSNNTIISDNHITITITPA